MNISPQAIDKCGPFVFCRVEGLLQFVVAQIAWIEYQGAMQDENDGYDDGDKTPSLALLDVGRHAMNSCYERILSSLMACKRARSIAAPIEGPCKPCITKGAAVMEAAASRECRR